MILVYFILFVGVLIFVHEMGHFIFAKLFDVKVLKFSLGFGPRAVGFRKGETDYCVAWVPLGGYVKMLGEDPTDEIAPEDLGRAFAHKPLWQRYIVILAGPVFNLIFPIVIYFIFFSAQTTLSPATIGTVFDGQPASAAGLRSGDVVLAIEGQEVRYWEDLKEIIAEHPGEPLRFVVLRDGERLERLITPREQVSRTWMATVQKEGRIGISPFFQPPQVGIADKSSPAARAGLQTGDLVTTVNGKAVERWEALQALLAANRGQSLRVTFLRPGPTVSRFMDLRRVTPRSAVIYPEQVTRGGAVSYWTGLQSAEFFVREVEEGSPAAGMGIRPGDWVVEFNGKPVKHWDVIILALQGKVDTEHTISWVPPDGARRTRRFKMARVTFVDEYRQEHERYVFGAQNYRVWKMADPVPIRGRFTYALTRSVSQTGEIIALIGLAMVQLFRGAIPSDTIGGPLMLAYTAQVAAKKGWDTFLRMLALISINLGILNLLPIPILDGGHIMFFTIEAIKRRRVSLRIREVATYVGLVLLISLMILAFKNDIVRYWFK